MDNLAAQKTIILIPSLNPDGKLVNYVKELQETGFCHIVLVDDGSREECRDIFRLLEQDEGVTVLRHKENRGKGRALKTGFAYCMEHFTEAVGVITADSDGQHSPKDTLAVAKALCEHEDAIVLGTRDFNGEQVPFKSRYGNKITTAVFRLLYGKQINDTQTGLRGIGKGNLPFAAGLAGERFEYETGMLIAAVRKGIPLVEVIIETIYIDENAESHFRPVRDSMKIYGVMFGYFFKYMLSSFSAALIDLAVFWLLHTLAFAGKETASAIFAATLAARVISSAYNFAVNRKLVFRASGSVLRQALGYYALAAAQMLCSAGLVYLFTKLLCQNATVVKAIVDICLFFISFQIQHRLIFREKQ